MASRRRRRAPGWVPPFVLAAFFAVAPSYVEEWQLRPTPSHAVTLEVGDDVVAFPLRAPPTGEDGGVFGDMR